VFTSFRFTHDVDGNGMRKVLREVPCNEADKGEIRYCKTNGLKQTTCKLAAVCQLLTYVG